MSASDELRAAAFTSDTRGIEKVVPLDTALEKCGALERENERLQRQLSDAHETLSEIIIDHPNDPGVMGFDEGVGLDGVILRGSPNLRGIVLHILKDWEVASDNMMKLQGKATALSRALQTARHALEWIANGASHDPQRYAKSAIADLDQPEPAREPREKSLCVKE